MTLLQTPASVDIIDRAQLEERGDANVIDAITRAAGFSGIAHPGNGNSSVSSRGFTDANSITRLFDGTRQFGGVGVTFPFDTWSVDRIEVLRGPASVIYGNGAIGGVVNVVPKKPARGPIRNEISTTIGTENTQRLGFGSGGAINDKLSYRFDIGGNRSDGWVDRGDTRDLTFSGTLRLDISPEFNLQLSHAEGRQHPMRYFGTPLVNGKQLSSLRDKNYNVEDSRIDFADRRTEISAQWTPNADITVRSKLYQIDSHRYWRNAEYYDYIPATGLIRRSADTNIRHDQSEVGNTTDATFRGSLLGLKNQVSIGFNLSASTFKHTNNTYTGTPDPEFVDPFDPVAGGYASAIPFLPRYRNNAQSYAVFGEDRLELNDRWSIVAGLRYDHANVTRRNLQTDVEELDQNYSNVGWRLGTVFAPRPDLSFYAQYSEAADSVGGLLMISQPNSRFDLSTGKQLEIGVKNAFAEGKGEWTLALYGIRKDNLLSRDPTNPNQSIQVGQQSSRGIEGTLSLAFARNWQLDANASILHAQFDDFSEKLDNTTTVSRDGNVPTNVPERLANAWLSWKFQPQWTASAGLRYVGKRYADNANTLKLPSYTTTDMALRWDVASDTTLTLHGFNVFDKRYYTTAYYNSTQWLVGADQRFELTLNHRF
ncbi:MAG TPA: TonB-dependent receptor [Oxalicibacterium sp.]|uniref:TonB-dependent receptor n=1 Tax=Oxalicibacterium sp. TaxID=2766525 RepID=UPI002CBCDD28|nr:TonB-dependent receptor [Oxalicibacterium sp.]HWU97982.1 TonB-dependent receptor [Oxalicibacterium sp.]